MYKKMTSEEILEFLSHRQDISLEEFNIFERESPIKEIISALNSTTDEGNVNILCHIVGSRRSKRSVPTLLRILESPSDANSCDAAYALAKIGDINTGPNMLAQFINRPNFYYAVGLGSIKYKQAIPYLVAELKNSNNHTRGASAWSLGQMRAKEALLDIKIALSKENDQYCIDQMKIAVELIEVRRVRC